VVLECYCELCCIVIVYCKVLCIVPRWPSLATWAAFPPVPLARIDFLCQCSVEHQINQYLYLGLTQHYHHQHEHLLMQFFYMTNLCPNFKDYYAWKLNLCRTREWLTNWNIAICYVQPFESVVNWRNGEVALLRRLNSFKSYAICS